jgi:magnesium chelatase family protein
MFATWIVRCAKVQCANGNQELKQHCELDEATKELLKFAMADLNLSARAYDRILKVARTIADLAASEKILGDHVS